MPFPCRIDRISPECVRIRIAPEHAAAKECALHRYGFIFEDAVKREGEPTLQIVRDENTGGLHALDHAGNTLFKLCKTDFTAEGALAEFELFDPEENWIGFGDQTRKRLFHRGFTANCQLSNVASYIPVPFFMSTRNYAILVNTTWRTVFDMGCSDPARFRWFDRSGRLDFYVWRGDGFKAMLDTYTRLTGRPELPPKWSFGLWYLCRTQADDTEVMNDARLFREHHIPCDVIGLEPGWMENNYDLTTEKTWSASRFPLPDWQRNCAHTWIKALKRMGYKLELWLCNDYDLSFEEERRRGARPDSAASAAPVFCQDAELDEHFIMPRFADTVTKPGEAWFKHLEKFVEWGADFFKQDGAFQVSTHPDRVWRGARMSDDEMHNLYPLLYSRQMNEGFARFTDRRPLVFTVAGWTGFQHYCGTWTGDTGGRLETLGAMLNTSCVGHSWSTNDMEVAQPEGIHFGYLLPWSQINSWTYFRMPWLQGDRLFRMHREYAQLRSQLIPYLYSSARCSCQSGLPMLMPLAIEFEHDPNCRDILHEYLLGESLLVTIYKHDLYLPAGEWRDVWTGDVYSGNTVLKDFQWPENRGGGLFLRSGAIVPLGPVMNYIGERPADTLEVVIFPGNAEHSAMELYDDDGVSFRYRDGDFTLSRITLDRTAGGWRIGIAPDAGCRIENWSLRVALPEQPAKVLNNGREIGGEFDRKRRELRLDPVQPGEVVILR